MTESIVPYVIERLDDVINQDYLVLNMLQQKLERLRIQFVNIFRSLQAMGCENPKSNLFTAEVREVGYKVEKVLDKLYIKVLCWKYKKWSMTKLFLVRLKNTLVIYNVGKELRTISHEVGLIITSDKYGTIRKSIEKGEGACSPSPQYSDDVSPYKDDAVVCSTEEVKLVAGELLKVEEQCRVLTICGMGGLGKTNLAKHAFYHDDVQNHFGCRAWTSASQHFRAEDILRQILGQVSSFGEKLVRIKEVELVEKVYATLEGKRYLVVVDDIWSMKDWKMIQSAFPQNGIKGSKVVLTTRNSNIAAEVDPHRPPFVPHLLNDEEAWGVLCIRLFGNQKIMITEDTKSVGQEMVRECGGLPLAIGVLSSILQETTPNNWHAVAKAVKLRVREAEPRLLFTKLMLSYYDLPYHLKPCFLYLGIFPEKISIPVNVLIQMWIVEGFVSLRYGDHLSLEDLGRRFLDELIQRSLVQVVEKDLEGRVKTCQLHAMMRYACIRKAREDKFFEAGLSLSSSSKRLAIYLDLENCNLFQKCNPLRSSIFFSSLIDKSTSNISVIPKIIKPLRHLRVLDFHGVHFPEGKIREEVLQLIGRLCQLKYLGLRGTGLDKLPISVGNLVCLQFLDVRDNKSIQLPNVIWKMRELRCFYIDSGCCKENAHLKMDTLRELRVASHISAGSWTSDMFNFTNLQKLRIGELMPHSANLVIGSIAKGLDNLQSLCLQMKPVVPFPDLEPLSKKHQLLKLSLLGKLSSTPSHWPSDVVKLRLCHSRLNEDPMPLLGNLQKLRYLELLSDAFLGKELVCSTKGFPRLLYLLISALPQLEVWTVEKEAMPYLRSCDIIDCESLKVVPHEFQHKTSVKYGTEAPRRT